MIAAGKLLNASSNATITPAIVAPNIGISDNTKQIAMVGSAKLAGTSWKNCASINTVAPAHSAPIPETVS